MHQTPAHDKHSLDPPGLMPTQARCMIEAGCSVGALARAYKKLNPSCRYVGIEIEPAYARLASQYCDVVHTWDIETLDATRIRESLTADCWLFGDVREHIRDPWSLLSAVRASTPADGCVVARIPSAQHWRVQLRLNNGELRYEDAGLLDLTHLRWFTRRTIIELFEGSGLRFEAGASRIVPHPARERLLAGIRALAATIGTNPEAAVSDALPTQYVVCGVPA